MGKVPEKTIIEKYGSLEAYQEYLHKKLSGKHFYTNGIEDRKFADDEDIPEGWYRGRTNSGKGTTGYRWINNGKDKKLIPPNANIPKGWIEGNLSFSEEHKQNLSKSLKGKKRTEEQRKRIKDAHNTDEYKENMKNTIREKYGVDNMFQCPDIREKALKNAASKEAREKARQTNLEKLGVEYPMQSKEVLEKSRQTMLKKYGVDSNFKREDVIQKAVIACHSDEANAKRIQTCLERYGTKNPAQSEEVKLKMMNTNIEHRGVPYPVSSREVFEKQIQTNRERYGVEYNIQLPQSIVGLRDSAPNRQFAKLLDENKITYIREFSLGKYMYDFKVGNTLIEINPTATHNTLRSPFGNHLGIDKNYHLNKSNYARENGYNIINVFDWDDVNKIIDILMFKPHIYGRKTILKEVNKKDTDDFLKMYHLQNSCRGQIIRLGLYYNDELVSIMTFGKPRYNKNYQYELLRYCSSKLVIGGAEKLFKYFVNNYNPTNIISYCDLSKFSGNVYNKLGFNLKHINSPNIHWYNSNQSLSHITNNMLLQLGFDKLFKTNYGVNTSNEELIINEGYLPVYDCGQATFVIDNIKESINE